MRAVESDEEDVAWSCVLLLLVVFAYSECDTCTCVVFMRSSCAPLPNPIDL